MEINVTARLPKLIENACQLLFIFSDGKLAGAARQINTKSDNVIKQLFKSGDFSGLRGQTQLLFGLNGSPAERVLLIGLGQRSDIDRQQWLTTCRAAATALSSTQASSAISDVLVSCPITNVAITDQTALLVRELAAATYKFNSHPGINKSKPSMLSKLIFASDKKHQEEIENSARRAIATANGIHKAKDLGNLASNICHPSYLADQATQMAARFERLSTTILDEEEMAELGMGALLSVSQGSRQPAKLIVMNYQGKKRAGKPIVLVGKGVTFDTGGISIKPSSAMDEMKYDMCGAASVFGTLQAIAEYSPDINVIGIVAAAENMPDGDASRPGDVVTSMSGQSIEILNTDAEGRLVLCDALTYAQRFEPAAIIDIATLTGACVVALGGVASAVMGNQQEVVDHLIQAGERSGDRCWQLPLWEDYQSQLNSNFADMANIGGPKAGAITAGCFLARFATSMNWAHLDVAGTAWNSGAEKGATGRPVSLLMQYVLDRCDKIR